MNKLGLAAAACLTLFDVVAASAQDVPAPVFSWTGLYVGAQAGYRWDDTSVNCLDLCKYDDGEIDLSTAVAGVHLGYNIQPIPLWVVGVETDFSWGNGEDEFTLGGYDGTIYGNIRHSWDASFRVRGGYLVTPSVLLYATAGLGLLGEEVDALAYGPDLSESKVRTGWQAGLGVEAAVSAKWRVRAEWIHADYGSETYSPPEDSDFGIDTTTDTFRVGVSMALN